MPSSPVHQVIVAAATAVPTPFRSFAVRSEEAIHAFDARAPYDRVHLIRTRFLDAASLAGLAAEGRARMHVAEFGDIAYAHVARAELAAAAPGVTDLVGDIAAALRLTRVIGDDVADYRRAVAERIDYLASYGAGFHNDVARHWTRCLFWNLALELDDVEFVMPHAGVRVALAPGDLIVFDQTMAHGLCRPRDGGQAMSTSFEPGTDARQVFLSGELPLTEAQWTALGSPWLPVEEHERRGALDLMAAEFDDRSGAIKGLRALQRCMRRDTSYVDDAAA